MENKFAMRSVAKLYLQPDFADIHFEFSTGDRSIKVAAHKTILAVSSPVFQAMLFGGLKEGEVVKIADATANAFEEFLQFFYLPRVILTMENVETVTRLTHKYAMPECLDTIVEFLKNNLDDSSMFWGYQLAIALDIETLKMFCESNIQIFTRDAFHSDEFLHCDREVVRNILQLSKMLCGEADLFASCVEWARNSCKQKGLDEDEPANVRNQLGDYIYYIQFGTMADEDLYAILSNKLYEALITPDEWKDIFRAKMGNDLFASEIFVRVPRSLPNLKWNEHKILECRLTNDNGNGRIFVQSRESTWLSANVPVTLGGKIKLCPITNVGGYSTQLTVSIEIIEYDERSFEPGTPFRVLFKNTMPLQFAALSGFGSSSGSLENQKPILIDPKKMYEIRLERFASSSYYHYLEWKDEVKLMDDKVSIKFLRHPSDAKRRGLISSLQFNRISR